MKILCVDIGTGTQDIFLYDSRLDLENGLKLVLPSPTMMAHRRIREATAAGESIVLMGRQMGGGPSAWAVEAHARAGLAVYAFPAAALTVDDELAKVSALGVKIISEDEAKALSSSVVRIEFNDFDFPAIAEAFGLFGIGLGDLAAVAVGVFDHGAAPPGVSDRKFRFDYLDRRIRERNALSAFAYLSSNAPPEMSRLQAVAETGRQLDCPLIVMDTAPAAVLGARFDPIVQRMQRQLIVNVGNFHTLAFRLTEESVEGIFEHHTGEIDLLRLESLLRALADGSLRNEDVFNDKGHGALIYSEEPLALGEGPFDVIVTGPRRSLFAQGSGNDGSERALLQSPLRPYFAVPFGDMMMSGCFGLLAATADILPDTAGAIQKSLRGQGGGNAPWDLD
jgi:uncharacterized protein (DUF1786 family)